VEPDAVREVFRGRLVSVFVESWPGGEREVVHHPAACAVVGLEPTGRVLLVRQVREAVRESLLEIPAGILDRSGEDPAAAAARELFEETGYRAASIEPLGWIYTSPGFTDERIELFAARTDREPAGRPEEGIEVVEMPLRDALEAARDGRFPDAKTALALLLAGARWGGVEPPPRSGTL